MMKQTNFPTEQMPVIDSERGCCVTIGNFDGVHKGHQTLISHALDFARKVGMACVTHKTNAMAKTARAAFPCPVI